jgi:hypothetical protein
VSAKSIIIHPQFGKSKTVLVMDYDVSIIKLRDQLVWSGKVRKLNNSFDNLL